MRDAISNRISRRTFTGVPFTTEEQNIIIEMVNKVNAESGLTISFVEDGSKAFGSLKKSYGMFKNVRSLLLMKGLKSDDNLKEKIGYYGEEIVLDLTDMGFGSCWVGLTFDRDKFQVSEEEEIVCVVVIGKVETVTLKEKMIRAAVSKNRKPVEQRIETTTELPYWIRAGIEAVRRAPSAKNSQKVMFHYDGSILSADIHEDNMFDLIDLGIVKKHFEVEDGGRFELGNGSPYSRR